MIDAQAAPLAAFKLAFSTERIHLNNAGLAPISKPARDRVSEWAERFYREGYFSDTAYAELTARAREAVARLTGSDAARVAFFGNTSQAICQVAFGLRLSKDDEVLLFDQEYGSNLFPWREACFRSGARLVLAPSGP